MAQSPEEQVVEQEVRSIIADLDSGTRGGRLQDQEVVVSLYQQVVGENPSAQELTTAVNLLKGSGFMGHRVMMGRSQLLALLLAKKEKVSRLSREILARNLPLLRSLDLNTVRVWEPRIVPVRSGRLPQAIPTLAAHRDTYQLYYGYLHAHTAFSDGNGTPEEAYQFARDGAKLDFFSLTDHGELLLIWPWDDKWEQIKEVAQKYNQDGVFVALHGFEWSSPVLGHINVINSDDFACCLWPISIEGICEWISERPEAISRFNHPGCYFQPWEQDHFELYDCAVKQMVGVEMFNGGRSIREYFNTKGYEGKIRFFDEALQKGWMVGAVGGQDNHDKNWGLSSNFLVGVWARGLTRAHILEAHRERRTFASEDRNLGLSFQINGAEMGSRLTPGMKTVRVRAWDKDGEKFANISIYKGGVLLSSFDVNSPNPQVELSIEAKAGEYYYAFVTQADGNAAISSPIWIVKGN